MFVLTADQRASTRTGDQVTRLLADLEPWVKTNADHVVLAPERTVGDEIQILLQNADATADLALLLMREGTWAVGIGAGEVNSPLGDSPRSSSGPAFVYARQAVERAKGKREPVPLVVEGADSNAAEQATAIMQLLAAVLRKRTESGWEVADLLATGMTQKEAAELLGVSVQAVSQRVSSAMLIQKRRVLPIAAAMIHQASGGK